MLLKVESFDMSGQMMQTFFYFVIVRGISL